MHPGTEITGYATWLVGWLPAMAWSRWIQSLGMVEPCLGPIATISRRESQDLLTFYWVSECYCMLYSNSLRWFMMICIWQYGNTHTYNIYTIYICILCMVGSDPKNSSNFLTSLLTFLLCGHPRGRASDAWYLTWTEKNRGTIKSCLNSGLLEFARVCLFVFPLFASSQNRV